MEKKYFIVLIIVTLFVIFIIHFPDLFPLFVTPKGMVYLGHNSYFDPWDTNLYVSVIHYGQWGGLLLRNQFTSIPNNPIFIYPFLTVLGFIFKSVNPFLLFHVSAVFADVIFLFGLFYLLRKLGLSPFLSIFALLAICLGGGIGFFGWGTFYSADINSSFFTLYTTLQKAHEAIAVLAFTGALVSFYLFILQKQGTRKIVPILILLLVSVFIYPYTVISFFLISFLFLFIYRAGGRLEDKDYVHLGILALPSLIVVFFLSYQISSNPTFADIGSHIPIDLLSFLPGYGILIPLFLYQFIFLPKNLTRIFLTIWFLGVLTLGILPIGPGKVFLRGSFIPIATICILSLDQIVQKIQKISIPLFILFGILLIGSSIYIFCYRINQAYTQNPWVYISVGDFKVFDYLNKHSIPNSSVFSLMTLGNQIPAFTENTVYLGHTMQTPQAAAKQNTVIDFFIGNRSIDQKKDILKRNNISYILFGKNETSLYKKYALKGDTLYSILN